METSSTQQPNLDLPPGMRKGRNLSVVSERRETHSPSPSEADYAQAAKALRAKEKEYTAALASIKVAYAILGSRALVILSSIGSAAAFGWAIYSASGIALLGASVYTVLVFLPALYHASRNEG